MISIAVIVTDTAARILVHDIHKLGNRMLAITNNMTRLAFRRRNKFAVYDKRRDRDFSARQ